MDILIFSQEESEDKNKKSSLRTQSELSINLKNVDLTKEPSVGCRTFIHSKHSLGGGLSP